jgi:hypothetical protein
MLEQRHPGRSKILSVLLLIFSWNVMMGTSQAEPNVTSGIRVKFVHENAVYLEAGSSAGLFEGEKLLIRRNGSEGVPNTSATIGEIEIESVTQTSAAGKIVSSEMAIVPGDAAFLTEEGLRKVREQSLAQESEKYLQIASFTEGAPPEQELREAIPKPPLPEINRIRGRFGIDTSIMQISGSGVSSSQLGFILRLDATRLENTYWSASGYYRGRVQSHTNYQQQTLTDLINRTYHLSLTYDNPKSNWILGIGRLYVPWASSLDTLDGFYAGRRVGKLIVGGFAGTNPDPTSWNYDPNRQTAGALVNFELGSFDKFRFTSTSGIALSRVNWHPDRQFGFFENGIFYKHALSVYSNMEADLLNSSQNNGKTELKLSRNYLTFRLQPNKIIGLDINENYFRNTPTFDTRLIGTGLLDKFLFQGLSGGIRLSLPSRISIYADTGRSSRTGDQKPSWNYLGGITLSDILRTGVRLDYRYSRFDSSFGRGDYQTMTANRSIREGLKFEVQYGQQSLTSGSATPSKANFINGNADWYLGSSYFMGIGLTAYRGDTQHYNQYFVNLGYRFDNHKRKQ